jgi:signal transduction histidine kinase
MTTKMLFVDDETKFRLIIEQLFKKEIKAQKFHVFFALNGIDALETLHNEPDIDLVLTDINMPGMNGLSLLSKIQEIKPSLNSVITTIVISAYNDLENIRKAMNTGAFDFLTKPLDFSDMRITLTKAIEHVKQLKTVRQMEDAKIQAESANRAKSEFLTNMSHEIRTPMNAILGFCELLLEKTDNPRHKGYLESIYLSGCSLLNIINDVLDLAKIEAGRLEFQPEPTRVSSILNEIEGTFLEKIKKKGLQLKILMEKNVPGILMLDEIRIKQILFNLISNAIKFTHQGHIKVHVFCSNSVELPRNNYSFRKTVTLNINVEDTGIGIPDDQQKIIFESFRQRTGQKNREYGGTGLGLTITKKLVEMIGGNISVKSSIDKGSVFKVYLPFIEVIDKPSENNIINISQDEAFPSFKPATILLVDDIENNRLLVKEYLKGTPISVIEAKDGEQALILIAENNPDVILMDLRLPGKDGFVVTKTIKKNALFSQTPVIAMTASAMKDTTNRISKIFDGYLIKPFTRKKLFIQLGNFLKTDMISDPDPATVVHTQPKICPELPKLLKDNFSTLLDILEIKILPKWEEISEIFYIDDIVGFAGELKKIADTYPVALLEEYSRTLHEHAQNNNIDEIEVIMSKFPSIVQQIRNYL